MKAGSKIIKEEEVNSDAAPSIRSDIRSLESTWELLREKCTAVQLRYFLFSLSFPFYLINLAYSFCILFSSSGRYLDCL